jgi:hypothetical protein
MNMEENEKGPGGPRAAAKAAQLKPALSTCRQRCGKG